MPSGWPVFNVWLKAWFLLLRFQKVHVKTIFPQLITVFFFSHFFYMINEDSLPFGLFYIQGEMM